MPTAEPKLSIVHCLGTSLALLLVLASILQIGGCAPRARAAVFAAKTTVKATKITVKAGAAVVRTTGRAAGAAARAVTPDRKDQTGN